MISTIWWPEFGLDDKISAMNAQEKTKLKQILIQEIQEQEASIPGLSEALEAVAPSVSLGRLTRMEALNDKGVREKMLQKTQGRIRSLLQALERIDEQDFGICGGCGNAIPFARLEALPEAHLCVNCASRKR